jgi:hypothetical protein
MSVRRRLHALIPVVFALAGLAGLPVLRAVDDPCGPGEYPDLVIADIQEENPGPGAVFDYLARARNACPSGVGPLGKRSGGTPRIGRSCP